MRRFTATALALLLALAACQHAAAPPVQTGAAQAEPSKTGEPSRLERLPIALDGVRLDQFIRTDPVQQFWIVTFDLTAPGLRFALTPADRSRGMEHTAKLTTGFLDESGAQIAVNASYFLPFAGGSRGGDDFYPKVGDPVNVSGAALAGGTQVSPVETDLDLRVNAIVCFQAARIVILDGQVCPAGFPDGVAAGPRLLAGGVARSFAAFDNAYATARHPRTAIGVSTDGRTGWIVVADGRQPGYAEGASLEELVALFKTLGAAEALNLDGGGSTALAVREGTGPARLVNRPIHTGVPGRERPVANHIVVFAPPPARP